MDYAKFAEDLKAANKAAQEATEGMEDGGTANLDKVFLTMPRAHEAKVLEAIRNAGLYCRAKRRWIGDGYMLTVSKGQGDVNTKAVTVFVAEMERRGYDVLAYRQMD
ncbi:hypothetical protein EC604_01585 [Paenibacillus amylolyticus]|uniref:Uncharacterized protein n=1 Tax=Paenibacillus amylolyticus TaxID=1451 RepID=A0A5M9WLU8_PAEAM|nr:hypothetical protein [Paenibacillus amylolyticus]KAA8782539.1 hypothetical protein EC604_01585 [Paenibacillus amylolyticus]